MECIDYFYELLMLLDRRLLYYGYNEIISNLQLF